MKDENLVEINIAKRRSSILKTNMNRENGEAMPVAARRISFAENMKVKTFDETGCNTSELVPQPTENSGTCDMSLVNTTMNCENMSVEMEISQEVTEKSESQVQPSQPAKDSFGGSNMQVDSDDSDEEVTGDILNMIGTQSLAVTSAKTPASTTSGDESDSEISSDQDNSQVTEKILRRLTVTGDSNGTAFGSTTDTGTTMIMKTTADGSIFNESRMVPFSSEIRKRMEDMEKKRQESREKAAELAEFTKNFKKETEKIIADLKKLPTRRWMKK